MTDIDLKYKLFLGSIFFLGALTGGAISAIFLTIKEAQWREYEKK